jgi:hypothetical protein
MLRRVALVRTYVSEERITSFVSVTRIGELGTTLAETSNRCKLLTLFRSPTFVILIMEALCSSESSVLTRVARRNIPEDCVLQLKYCLREGITTIFAFKYSSHLEQLSRRQPLPQNMFSTGFIFHLQIVHIDES